MIRVTERKGGAALTIKVVPRASRNELGGVDGGILRVRLTAPPVGGAANEALVRLLAGLLDVPARDVEIVTGHTGRQKGIWVAGLSPQEARTRLERHLVAP